MKSKLNSKMFLLAMGLPMLSQAQTPAANEFRSAVGSAAPAATPASGNWTTIANWQKYDGPNMAWAAASTSGPATSSTALTTVLTGSAMTLSASSGANTLLVQSGASIKWQSVPITGITSPTASEGLRISGTSLENDGIIGGAPIDDSINIEVSGNGLTFALTGTGTTYVNRLRAYYGLVGTTINLNMPVTFTNQSSSGGSAVGLTGYYASINSTTSENVTVNVNSGITALFINGATLHYASQFYGSTSSSSGGLFKGGSYTYNINGIADMSASKGTTYFSANTQTATSVTTLNVSGLLKTGLGWSSIDSLPPGSTPGTVHMNILAGGIVDATPTTFKLDDSTRFVMADGTAIMKRVVAAADTSFPISTSYMGNNTLLLHNIGTADTFSVSLQNTFSFPTPPTDLTTVVGRQWTIKEAGTGGKLDSLTFTWLAAEQGSAVTATPSVYVRPATGGTQIEYVSGTNVAVSGSGTLASPYTAVLGVPAGAPAGKYFIGKAGLPTAVANVSNATDLNVAVAPNPATGKQISFQITGNKAGTYKVALYNVTGQVIYSNDVSYNASTTNYKINMNNMPAGIYQLQISNANTNIGKRVVVE